MIVHGRVTFFRISCESCSAAFGSRYSLRNFTELLLKSTEFFEVLEDALRFLFVDHADGEAHVDEHIFPNFGFGDVGQVDLLANAAEVDPAAAERNVAVVDDFNHPSWNRKTHVEASPIFVAPGSTSCSLPLAPAQCRRRWAEPGGACALQILATPAFQLRARSNSGSETRRRSERSASGSRPQQSP